MYPYLRECRNCGIEKAYLNEKGFCSTCQGTEDYVPDFEIVDSLDYCEVCGKELDYDHIMKWWLCENCYASED